MALSLQSNSIRNTCILLVFVNLFIHPTRGASFGTSYAKSSGFIQQDYGSQYGPQRLNLADPLYLLRNQIANTDRYLYLDKPVSPQIQSAASKLSVSAILSRVLPCQVVEDSLIKEPSVFRYHNFDELTSFLQKFSSAYPSISRLYSAGKSVQNRDLWVIEIGNNPGVHEPGKSFII